MSEQIYKRRKRYKGTHPRNFEEKYKELDPEMYPETIEKVISKGSTPAGMHISIMVDEILEFLDIQPGQVGLDCTLGYGGHTSKMLEKLDGQGHVYGLDIDSIEIEKTTQRLRNKGFDENLFTSILTNFRNIDEVSEKYGQFDFVLADLGVSSMQIDNPERGFSYKKDGPLDLRLNPKAGRPASQILKELSREDLENILLENSDEPYADILAKNIYSFIRSGMEVETTRQLYKIIDKTLNFIEDKNRKDIVNKTAARVFQALRIEVNQEFEVLYEQFVSAESLKNLKAEYESRLANKDNRVNVLAPSGAWQGICLGIKEDGALLVQREDGKVEEVIAGEVSVRGIYGYV